MRSPRHRPPLPLLLGGALAVLAAAAPAAAAKGNGAKKEKKGDHDRGPGALVVGTLDLDPGLTALGMYGFEDPTTAGASSLFANRAIGFNRMADAELGLPLFGKRGDMFYALVGARVSSSNLSGQIAVGATDESAGSSFVGSTDEELQDVQYNVLLGSTYMGLAGHTQWTFGGVSFGRAFGRVDADGDGGTETTAVTAMVLGVKYGLRIGLAKTFALRVGGELLAYPGGLRPEDPGAVLPLADGFGFPVYSLSLLAGLQVIL
jgi:hypothetical protein